MAKLPGWKRVYIADDPLQAATVATALEAAGLTPQLRGMELWGVAVEILFSEGAAPSVWVPAVQETQALHVVEQLNSRQRKKLPDWICHQCGEKVPGGFETCWQCGAESPLDVVEQETSAVVVTEPKSAVTDKAQACRNATSKVKREP